MENTIPIVFATDDNYIKQMLTCIISIMKNKKKETIYTFYILHSVLCSKSIDIIEKFAKKRSLNINLIDISPRMYGINLQDYMRIKETTQETFYRFFMPSIFNNLDKVLYLDCDTVVLKDLTKLYNTDIENSYMGGVLDLYITSQVKQILEYRVSTVSTNQPFDIYLKEILGLNTFKYYNAGVLLFNLKKMREDNIEQKLFDFAKEHPHLEYQDQDILNAVCQEKIKELPIRYNITPFPQTKKDRKLFNIDFKKLDDETVIFHYADRAKPWKYRFSRSTRDITRKSGLWWKYYRKNPLYKITDEYIFFLNFIGTSYIHILFFFKNLFWNIKSCIINLYWWTKTFLINLYYTLYWWTRTFLIFIYWHILVALYWKIRHLCWLIFIKYTFRPIKKFYNLIIKKFINKIVKTIIKHTKKILKRN